MAGQKDIGTIVDRIASHTQSADDLAQLRRSVTVHGDRNVVQVGRYNVRLDHGENVHIGDRIYQGAQADAIRAALSAALADTGRGTLRGLSGFVTTVGFAIALTGMAIFFYQLISVMGSNEFSSGPPPLLLQGFGLAFVGVVVGSVGGVIRGWERPRGPRPGEDTRWTR